MPSDFGVFKGRWQPPPVTRCVLGEVAVSWRKKNGRLHVKVAVPPGTAATLEIPSRTPGEVLESGGPLLHARGITAVRQAARASIITVGSGRYALSVPL